MNSSYQIKLLYSVGFATLTLAAQSDSPVVEAQNQTQPKIMTIEHTPESMRSCSLLTVPDWLLQVIKMLIL